MNVWLLAALTGQTQPRGWGAWVGPQPASLLDGLAASGGLDLSRSRHRRRGLPVPLESRSVGADTPLMPQCVVACEVDVPEFAAARLSLSGEPQS